MKKKKAPIYRGQYCFQFLTRSRQSAWTAPQEMLWIGRESNDTNEMSGFLSITQRQGNTLRRRGHETPWLFRRGPCARNCSGDYNPRHVLVNRTMAEGWLYPILHATGTRGFATGKLGAVATVRLKPEDQAHHCDQMNILRDQILKTIIRNGFRFQLGQKRATWVSLAACDCSTCCESTETVDVRSGLLRRVHVAAGPALGG